MGRKGRETDGPPPPSRPNVLQGQSALTWPKPNGTVPGELRCSADARNHPPQSPVDATLREYLSPGAVRSAASAAGSREGNVSAAGDSSVQSKGTLLVVLGRQSFTEGERNGGSWTCTKHGNRRRQSACRTSGSGGDLLAPSVSCLGGRKRPMIRASKTRLNNDRTVPLVTPPFPDTEGDWLVTAGTRGRKP